MGRPPSNGAPSFRFNPAEVAQMEAILQKYEGHVPPRDLVVALAKNFSNSPERAGKVIVQMKQVWNWFQNRRYALRSKLGKSPGLPNMTTFPREEVNAARHVASVPQQMPVPSAPNVARNFSEPPPMEFEAKSSRDGAWYDVQQFLSTRYVDTSSPEVLVRFAGFGPEEDEWLDIKTHVRPRSLPCETAECILVLPGDLVLCFQEGKEQALYFDAHILDAQRMRHDIRGCRCRFLVRYDHDQSEEVVPLRKLCRRPETDYRLQQLHAAKEAACASVPLETLRPVVDLTSSGTSRMINQNIGATAIAVAPLTAESAVPSASIPAAIQAQTPHLVPTFTQASTSTPARASTLIQASASTRTPAPTLIQASPATPATAPTLVQAATSTPTPIPTPTPALALVQASTSAPNTVPSSTSVQASTSTPAPTLVQASTSTLASTPTPSPTIFTAPTPAPSSTSVSSPPPFPNLTPVAKASEPVAIPISAPVTLTATSSPTPFSESVKVECDNQPAAPVPVPKVVESVNLVTQDSEATAHPNAASPGEADIVPQPKKVKICDQEITALPESSNSQAAVPGPEVVEKNTPTDSAADSAVADRSTVAGNSTVPTEDVKE